MVCQFGQSFAVVALVSRGLGWIKGDMLVGAKPSSDRFG